MDTLLYLGIIFVLGAFTEWISPKLHLSKVVGFMLTGLVIAPGSLGIIPEHFISNVHIVTDLALSLIAVLVGASLKRSKLKGLMIQILSITFFEALFAFIIVSSGFYLLASSLLPASATPVVIAILLGGIASATAPAATLALIHELKAYGNFSILLLSVVALDDAAALILFALALTVSQTILNTGVIDFSGMINALIIIFGSITIGILGGLLTAALEKLFSHHKGMETIATLGMIFIVYSICEYYVLEPLLGTLVMGVVLTNFSKDFDLVEKEIDNHIVEIVFMLFFMLSAMHLQLSALSTLPLAIIAYIIFRAIGKITGAYIGAKLSKADTAVQQHLGKALIPQAGVAIGLALSIQSNTALEAFAPTILNIIIATTLVHELIGPFMTEYALKHAKNQS